MHFKSLPGCEQTRGTVFKAVARERSAEAAILYKENKPLGAIYLAGYAIECHLKYAICERNGVLFLPTHVRFDGNTNLTALYVHDWSVLITAARMRRQLKNQRKIEAVYYFLLEKWRPGLRYQTTPFKKVEEDVLYRQLEELYEFFKEIEP